jgi:hypothetical protein
MRDFESNFIVAHDVFSTVYFPRVLIYEIFID